MHIFLGTSTTSAFFPTGTGRVNEVHFFSYRGLIVYENCQHYKSKKIVLVKTHGGRREQIKLFTLKGWQVQVLDTDGEQPINAQSLEQRPLSFEALKQRQNFVRCNKP